MGTHRGFVERASGRDSGSDSTSTSPFTGRVHGAPAGRRRADVVPPWQCRAVAHLQRCGGVATMVCREVGDGRRSVAATRSAVVVARLGVNRTRRWARSGALVTCVSPGATVRVARVVVHPPAAVLLVRRRDRRDENPDLAQRERYLAVYGGEELAERVVLRRGRPPGKSRSPLPYGALLNEAW